MEFEMNEELADMKILQQIVKGQIEIRDIEMNSLDRLIALCSKRLNQINKKIEDKEIEISKNRKFSANLKKI